MSTRTLLEDLKNSYSKLVIQDDENATLPIDGKVQVVINANKPVKEWFFSSQKTNEKVVEVTEHMKDTLIDLSGVWHDIKERAGTEEKNPLDNLDGFEGLSGYEEGAAPDCMIQPEEKPQEIPKEEAPKKDNWSKPAPKKQERVSFDDGLETVTLPVPIGGIVRPVVSAREALAVWDEFQALKTAIIEDSDKQVIEVFDKRTNTKKKTAFIKKSGWRKLATCFNLTDRIVDETKEVDGTNGFVWTVKVVCRAPNGRETEGVGKCASTEKSGARLLHDVYSTAHTRAKNRAISDMIAAGEVSAEEMGT